MYLQRLNIGDEATKQQSCIFMNKEDGSNARDRETKANTGISSRNHRVTSSGSEVRANRFLRVHLQVLKALYQQDTSSDSSFEDHLVEEKHWEFIKCFLKERDECAALVQRAQRMSGIYNEAMEFQKNADQFPLIDDEITAHRFGSPPFNRFSNQKRNMKGTRSSLPRSSALVLITQPSPRYQSNRPYHTWTRTGNRSGSKSKQLDHDVDKDTGNAFGIVSGLLKRKHHLASKHLSQRTKKLRALKKESQSRIEFLNSRLVAIKAREKSLLSDFGASREDFLEGKEECEDCQVRIETKLRLWKLLLHDFIGTILIK